MRAVTRAACLLLSAASFAAPALAQGQDGTRAERNALVIAQMLPGYYDNANQAYFDRRLKVAADQRHDRRSVTVSRSDQETSGTLSFTFAIKNGDGGRIGTYLYTLAPDNDAGAVRMARVGDDGAANAACDLLWNEEAGQFRGRVSAECAEGPEDMFLSEDALWIDQAGDNTGHYTMEIARDFSCYIDVPGVGGGRDIPYKRYEIADMHDRGSKAYVTLEDGRELYVSLQNIRWPMNNLEGIFTRHSFVMYVGERMANGEDSEISYTWTVPTAPRIGMNLKWMLVNCFTLSNEDVTPFFKDEPIR